MPVVPTLMVLYTNDAVEVRYSDGSRFHLTPCGSTFFYHTATDGSHPVAGLNVVQQRCQFVTSEYRQKAMSALDFRNRFAERPFLAQEFLHQDQIIALYAEITATAWAKSLEDSNIEKLPDGSVRVTSEDNYASLILSPHKRDFTVCFLSLLSPEKNSDRSRLTSHKKRTKDLVNSDSVSKQVSTSGESSEDKGKLVIFQEELNISPITQASPTNSPSGLSQASGSPVTPQIHQPGANNRYMLFSTPTRGLEVCELRVDLEDPVCTPYGKTAVFRDCRQERHGDRISGADLDEEADVQKAYVSASCYESKGEKKRTVLGQGQGDNQSDVGGIVERRYNLVGRDHWQEENNIIERENYQGSKEYKCSDGRESANSLQKSVQHSSRETTLTGISQTSDVSRSSGQHSGSDTSQETTQKLYCWVTKHISYDECPLAWSHVVRLALEAKDQPDQLAKGNTTNLAFHLDYDHKETGSTKGVDVPSPAKQTKLDQQFKKPMERMSATKQKEIDDALLKLIVGKVLPLSLIDHKYFRNFVMLLNPKFEIPGRKSVSSKLAEKKDQAEKKVKEEPHDVLDIAVTHDAWTSLNTESYSTVTAHFISKDWELKSVVLETRKVEGSHTGEDIKERLLATQR